MRKWLNYEIPLLLVALVNWLLLYAFTASPVFIGFWWVLLAFSLMTFLLSLLLQWGEKRRPLNLLTCITGGKAMKFMATIALLLVCLLWDPDEFMNYCITIGLFFLSTLIVDTALILRFARMMKANRYEES